MHSFTHRRRRPEFPFWLLAIALVGVLAGWNFITDTGYAAIFAIVTGGIGTTLFVTAIAFAVASLLGLVLALMRLSRWRVLREVAQFYIEIVRGVPVLVLLFYIAFVGAPFVVDMLNVLISPLVSSGVVPALTLRSFDFLWRAIFALMICYSAFIAEVFRAGIESVDRGQVEAGLSLGLSRWRIFRHIVAPQALRTITPPLGNDFIAMLKDSALVSALGVQDITQLGKVYASGSFRFFETYNVVAFLYLVMTIGLSLLIRLLERQLKLHR